MSDLTRITIVPVTPETILVTVHSFRGDALPDTALNDPDDVATTAFVLFCEVAFRSPGNASKASIRMLQRMLQDNLPGDLARRYFPHEITRIFIRDAKVKGIRSQTTFLVQQVPHLTDTQRQDLYQIMGYSPLKSPSIEDNFEVDVFRQQGDGVSVEQILGRFEFTEVAPFICFQLTFRDPELIRKLVADELESPLDSHIRGWL